MRDSVPSARYSSVCNVLRQWRIWLIPTYRVYRLYDRTHTWCIVQYTYCRPVSYSIEYIHSIQLCSLVFRRNGICDKYKVLSDMYCSSGSFFSFEKRDVHVCYTALL